ncbi:class I tRNA ligase family protein [Candidatus Saccharibacteria bacterium]|nr:class I tRNA ligase family protein [Candidatus Saccharibacteria bacterium]
MKLYNTPARKLEEFKPQDPSNVKIYTCGPTVYSTPHIGNYAAYIYWDLLIRTLKANGYTVHRVLNLTDVGHLTSDGDTGEDKLEKGAKREGKTVWEIADSYISVFKNGFEKLGLIEPTKWARATDYIKQSEALVEKLIDNGFTYEISDGVYYNTSKFANYADFAHLDLDNLKAGARVAFSSEKKNPSDFAVWKFIKEGEDHAMRWDFLGRPGYPGWHLECSSIIHTELQEPIDIHTGGIDHIPVHHTNEIAQTYGAYNKILANTWLHCNFITINGEKISKSLGNIITLEDLETNGYTCADYKLWLYQGHYRSERNFTWDDLAAARNRRLSWRNKIALIFQTNEHVLGESDFKAKLLTALNDDLNSSAAFALIDASIEQMTLDDWQYANELFGLDLIPEDITAKILPRIKERNAARDKKDWPTADNIRDELLSDNISLLDTPNGTFWQLTK